MEPYIFDDNKGSIKIFKNDLPAPWINYLSNGRIHGFISQVGGGTLWMDNPSKYKFTRYRQYNIPIDSPGFYVYIREKDGTVWSPSFRPAQTELDSFYAEHLPGKTVFYAEKNGIEAVLKVFIAPDFDICMWNLEVKSSTDSELDVFAYVEFAQQKFLDEVTNAYYWRHMLKTWFDEESQAVKYLYHHYAPANIQKVPLLYFASDKEVLSYSGDRDAFLGNYREERNPISVERGYCGNEAIWSGEPCGALHIRLNCKKNVTESAAFFLGAKSGGLINAEAVDKEILKELTEVRKSDVREKQEEKLDDNWNSFIQKFECDIPDKNAQRQINIWGPVASMHTARYSRCINANAPGTRTLGYRDTCQDMLAISYRDIKMAEDRFIYLLSKQYKSGKAIHCEGENENALPDYKTRCDDHLWLAFLAYSLIAEKGDASILEKTVPYLSENHIAPGERATVWEHLLAAVEFTQNNLGVHGLPLTYHGDWNDIIYKFSAGGKGESVFAAQQYVKVLELMTEMAEYIEDKDAVCKLKAYMDEQRKNISRHCWNGEWWYRCFDDEGKPIGGKNDEFGKIWINSQTWSVISNSGEKGQQRQAMDAVSNMLDTGVGLMKLAPGFKTWPEIKEPFSGYNPGTGENGAVFCHAHTWAIIAEAMLGNAELAWKYYNDLVPHNALQKVGLEQYRSEPYTWCSNIVGFPNNKQGWGNVSHITGAVAWMNVAATQYLLGIRPTLWGIEFDPCIPSEWESFSVKRMYRGCMLDLHFKNEEHIQKGVKCLEIDGKQYAGGFISEELIKGKENLSITVIMGK